MSTASLGPSFHRAGRWPGLAAAALALLLAAPSARAGDTVLVSVSTEGVQGDDDSGSISGRQCITPNGRFVSFESLADTLVGNDSNGDSDVYVRDRKKGTTTLASVSMGGAAAGNGSLNTSISANGRFVAFQSSALDLVQNDGNGGSDIFVRDLKKGETTRVSVDSAGTEVEGSSFNPRLSSNGRWVVFQSSAATLVPEDDNDGIDVFVHDRKKGTTVRASVTSAGAEVEADSLAPSISANGRFVCFESAGALVEEDRNGENDVYVHDLKLHTTVRVSVDAAGAEGDGTSTAPMISANGRYVAFASSAPDLVPDDGSPTFDIFVKDLKTGAIERLSVNAEGVGGGAGSGTPWITANGRFVAFHSDATDLVPDDLNATTDVFVADRKKDTLVRASVDSAALEADGNSLRGTVSSSGRYVAFDSSAEDLVAEDDNEAADVFLRDLK